MATAMLGDRSIRKKMQEDDQKPPPKKQPAKRKSPPKPPRASEQNNNVKRQRLSADSKDDMLAAYQPWVIQTYGDLAKTKTITLKKYARILRTLRGEEVVSADNSKFRFWVKAKGFHEGKPQGYDPKPADAIVGRYSVCDMDEGIRPISEKLAGSAKDPSLYVPNAPFKNSTGEPVYRKVAVVENFFDIIYNVHVELEGRPGKHAGQKRTYRTITETYAFLPREAVTRFLLGCTECQKHPRSPSPVVSVLPTPSPSPTLPLATATAPILPHLTPQITQPLVVVASDCQGNDITYLDLSKPVQNREEQRKTPPPEPTHEQGTEIAQSQDKIEDSLRSPSPAVEPRRSSNPLDVCNLTSRDPPRTPPKKRHLNHLSDNPLPSPPPPPRQQTPQCPQAAAPGSNTPKLWSPVEGIERDEYEKRRYFMPKEIDYSLPITTTYLKYMRTLGCTDEDALKFENRHVSCIIEHFLHEMIAHYFH